MKPSVGYLSRLKWFSSTFSALFYAFPIAWLTAVLLNKRALPWNADRWWWLIFVAALTLGGIWRLRFSRKIDAIVPTVREGLTARLWAGGLLPIAAIALLLEIYASDQLNDLLERGHWRLLFVTILVLLVVISEVLQKTVLIWLSSNSKVFKAVAASSLSRHIDLALLSTLAAIGVIQAAASVSPIGDDIWHYTEVADALLTGSSYPIVTTSKMLQDAGMGSAYPALPIFPILLALSFTLFGRNLVGVALPTVVATAIFPLAMYSACKAITGSRLTAYSATILLFLFPVYQIHVIGTPEPDTVFVTLLLLGAAFAAKANSTPRQRYWIAMGVAMGLASLTRHEGVAYSAAMYLFFFVSHRLSRNLRYSLLAYLAVLTPFILFYYSISGSPWPSTFGRSILGWNYLEANLTTLSWTSLGWYSQAVGLEREVLVGLLIALGVICVVGCLTLGMRNPALVGIPVAGIGNILAGLFMHPLVVYSPFPVEFLRHISYGIPFAAIGVAYSVWIALRGVSYLLSRVALPQWLMLAILLTAISGLVFYEAERLSRPEWYFGGKATLLWTGSSYLLADVVQHPIPLPVSTDPRSGEEIRAAMARPIDANDLRRVNLSEPYHWTSLLIAMFGLMCASISVLDTRPRRSPPMDHMVRRIASEPPAYPS